MTVPSIEDDKPLFAEDAAGGQAAGAVAAAPLEAMPEQAPAVTLPDLNQLSTEPNDWAAQAGQTTGGSNVADIAKNYLGVNYVYGGNGMNGIDCLAEGTAVRTMRGDVPIEAVTTNDYVLTRKGWRRVLRAWLVREGAEVIEVTVNGRVLRGTPDHRVWTENRGWVALETVTSIDALVSARCAVSRSRLTRRLGALSGSAAVSTSRSSTTMPGQRAYNVYDLTVEGEHEFFAEGVLVHNCSGLVQQVYKQAYHVALPRVSYQQANMGKRTAFKDLKPGDLVAWDNSSRNPGADHIAIWLGNGQIIEAAHTGTKVRIRTLDMNGYDAHAWGVSMAGVR